MMRLHYNSPVILTYALLSLGVLLLGLATDHSTTHQFFVIRRAPLSDPLLYVRFLTYVLGHASFDHYFGNLTMMLLVGPMVEEKYGSRPLLLMMLVTALIGGLSHVAFFSTGALGASGVVFMLILLTPFTNMRRGRLPLTFILVALIFIGREVVCDVPIDDNVSRFGHILGGISGAIMGMYINGTKARR